MLNSVVSGFVELLVLTLGAVVVLLGCQDVELLIIPVLMAPVPSLSHGTQGRNAYLEHL